MAVPTTITDFSTTASSNSPGGTETVGSSLDDYLRGIQAVVRAAFAHKGNDIASAATTDIGAVAGLAHDITGTTTITSFGTIAAGIPKILKFEGALTLTHNSTSLILPGGANITTADGDIGIFISEGSGNWRCVSYFRAANAPTQDASDTAKGVIEIAVQSEMETATDTTRAVTPGRQHYHPSAAKGWVSFSSAGNMQASYNVTSITDTGTGDLTVNWATDFSSANYCPLASGSRSDNSFICVYVGDTPAAGTTRVIARDADGNNKDADLYYVVAFGDQ